MQLPLGNYSPCRQYRKLFVKSGLISKCPGLRKGQEDTKGSGCEGYDAYEFPIFKKIQFQESIPQIPEATCRGHTHTGSTAQDTYHLASEPLCYSQAWHPFPRHQPCKQTKNEASATFCSVEGATAL